MDMFKVEVKSALLDLAEAMHKIEKVCQALSHDSKATTDYNDTQLAEARRLLNAAIDSIGEIKITDV